MEAQGILGITTPAEHGGIGGDQLSTAISLSHGKNSLYWEIFGAQGILGSITTPTEHGGIRDDQLSTAITWEEQFVLGAQGILGSITTPAEHGV